jgi:hypothetical protein
VCNRLEYQKVTPCREVGGSRETTQARQVLVSGSRSGGGRAPVSLRMRGMRPPGSSKLEPPPYFAGEYKDKNGLEIFQQPSRRSL